jgi:hypothetical protein
MGLVPLTEAQDINVLSAIRIIRSVDSGTADQIQALFQSGGIVSVPWNIPLMAPGLTGFTPGGLLGITNDVLAGNRAALSGWLIHEFKHILQQRTACGWLRKHWQELKYVFSGFNYNKDLELPAYRVQVTYLTRLMQNPQYQNNLDLIDELSTAQSAVRALQTTGSW